MQDILILFSMILGEAVDEGLIPANPCRKLRISFDERANARTPTPTKSTRWPDGSATMTRC